MRHGSTLVVVLLVAGCASAGGAAEGGSGTVTTTHVETSGGTLTLEARPEGARAADLLLPVAEARVWAVLPAVYEELGIAGGAVSGQARTFGSGTLRAQGRLAGSRASLYLDCGRNPIGAPVADNTPLEVAVSTTLESQGSGSTRVRTHLRAMAVPSAGGNTLPCSSTGKLETRIQERIGARLASGS